MHNPYPSVHPGEILKEEFLEPYKLTQKSVADSLGVGEKTINEICRGKRGISAAMALKLARFFGNTPQFWLNLQMYYDLHQSSIVEKDKLDKIKSLKTA